MQRLSRLIFATAFCLGAPQTVVSQVALFNSTALDAECKQGRCGRALDVVIERLWAQELPVVEFNSQLGVLAAVLIAAAKDAPPDQLAQIADSLSVLAALSTDSAQKAAIERVALAVSRGEAGVFDTASPFAVSPA